VRDAPEQLALGLRLRADATFANFIEADNAATLHALQRWLQAAEGGIFYLFGAAGSGRSHLLQAACHAGQAALYLPLDQFAAADPTALLENLEQAPLICLDDIDTVTADARWCEQLFHLCNRALAAQSKLLVSAAAAPAQLDCVLADLRSRLAWGGSFRLSVLNDDGRRQLLQARAHERGFDLAEDVAAYILTHHSRDLAALLALLESLDRQSLAQQKRITIPFVRRIIDTD
jgi:DnaA-homolog protein